MHIGDKIQVEIREVDDRGKLSLVPVEVVEREAAGEDLSGGGAGGGGGGDRPREPREPREPRDSRENRGDGHHRTRRRTRGQHE